MTAPALPPRTSYVPHLLLATMVAVWAISFVVAKVALLALTPFALVATRFSLATLCLLPLALMAKHGDLRRTLVPGLFAGAALGLGYFLQMFGVRETTASMGGFVTGLIVLLVAVGGFVFFGSRFGVRSLLGLVLGLGGIVVLCLPEAGVERVDSQRGILLQVGAACSFACHALLLSHYGRGLPIAAFTLWQLGFVSAAGWAATGIDGSTALAGGHDVLWDAPLVLALAYLGVVATAVAIGVQGKVQHRIPPMHVALLFALQPLFAALAGWGLQGDRLGVAQWCGGALIVAGVIVTSLDRA